MKIDKKLATLTFYKNVVKQFVTIILLFRNNAKDINYFTNFLQIADVVSDYW